MIRALVEIIHLKVVTMDRLASGPHAERVEPTDFTTLLQDVCRDFVLPRWRLHTQPEFPLPLTEPPRPDLKASGPDAFNKTRANIISNKLSEFGLDNASRKSANTLECAATAAYLVILLPID